MSDELSYRRSRSALVQALAKQGIGDRRVLEVMGQIPREAFVPPDQRHRAYENYALSIAEGQTISQPYIVALMTEALELRGTERVLEIGTGSGYQCAILAKLAQSVFTVERLASLSWHAQEVLRQLGIENVRYRIGDGSEGWSSEAPFDRIIVTASAPRVPTRLAEQLAEGGILVMPVGTTDRQSLYAYHKVRGELEPRFLCECRFVPLIGTQGWPEGALED